MKKIILYFATLLFFTGLMACSPQTDTDTTDTVDDSTPVIDEAVVDTIESTVDDLEAELDDVLDGLE